MPVSRADAVSPDAQVVVPAGTSWAGAYACASLGHGARGIDTDLEEIAADVLDDVDIEDLPRLGLTEADAAWGAHLGYNWQRQRVVYGLELAVLGSEAELAVAVGGDDLGIEMDYAARLMGRIGYQFAQALFHGTAGMAYAEFSGTGELSGETEEETRHAYGVGMVCMLSQNLSLGAEHVRHRFEDVTGFDEVDGEVSTTSARMSCHFRADRAGLTSLGTDAFPDCIPGSQPALRGRFSHAGRDRSPASGRDGCFWRESYWSSGVASSA